MKDPVSQKLNRPAQPSMLYLFTLVMVPVFLALLLCLSNPTVMDSLPDLGRAQDLITVVLIALAVALACLVQALRSRLQALETARGLDNHAALHDALTGAANRRQFDQRLEEILQESEPACTLLMVDLDRFKPINDLYGHAAGDALLKEITHGIRRLLHADDLLARLGGDEFALLLQGRSDDRGEQLARDVHRFVTRYRLNWEGQRLSVGASIGMVGIHQPGVDAASLLAASDEALYAAKEAGRGAIFAAETGESGDGGSCESSAFRQVETASRTSAPCVRSHVPEDGRKQELHARIMRNLSVEASRDRRRPQGARRRHDVRHWICVEPGTIGDCFVPGMQMRELISDAASHKDGGADFARWVMAMAMTASARLPTAALGRIHFVLPLPASAFVAEPDLADELLRCNALSHHPMRHITFILHGVETHYDSEHLARVHKRLKDSDFRLGYEIRADNLDVLAPLRYIAFDEIHLGRELIAKLRPGSADNATLDAMRAVTEKVQTTLVAACVESEEEAQLLAGAGIRRLTGSISGPARSLHEVLSELPEAGEPGEAS